MIEAHIIDSRGVYLRTEQVEDTAPQPPGAVYDSLPAKKAGKTRMWLDGVWLQVANASVPPLPGAPPPAWPCFVGNQKLDLFTRAEQLAVVTATMSDPFVKLMYDRLLGASFFCYEDPETEQGLALLEAKGLLTPERKAEIVAAMQPA